MLTDWQDSDVYMLSHVSPIHVFESILRFMTQPRRHHHSFSYNSLQPKAIYNPIDNLRENTMILQDLKSCQTTCNTQPAVHLAK